jgi:phosphatidylserine/phosphatidylglycerophosphate/cardiolipin synthase-like enzyme
LPNPANLGKEVIVKYTKKSEILRREVDKLSEKWPSIKTESSYSYTDMADRLFAKGIATDLSTKEIRIMTPYTDYELKKYVSTLRTLVTKGYELRVLSRLPVDSEPWKVFKESLFKGLGEKAKAVKVRTYTRYKEFLLIPKLTRTTRAGRKEFGVHAKLFIVGDSKDGALLLGSANLLENSFNWNPECGLYTEDEKFIESAKAFFDFVWDLCENDSLDFSALDKVPEGPFFPRVYHYES